MRIDVVGGANIDLVARLERLPEAGETLASTSFSLIPGGKGANQAVAAARLGAAVRFVGAVGEDAHGETLLRALAADGIDTTTTRRLGPSSGQAFIFVDRAGDTMIVTVGGANMELDVPDMDVAGAGCGADGAGGARRGDRGGRAAVHRVPGDQRRAARPLPAACWSAPT